jgi:hypothetical protein
MSPAVSETAACFSSAVHDLAPRLYVYPEMDTNPRSSHSQSTFSNIAQLIALHSRILCKAAFGVDGKCMKRVDDELPKCSQNV